MDKTKILEYYVEISMDTKAAIIESILGQGYLFTKTGYKELKDMPDIINEMEKDLRSYRHKNFKREKRGQHPDTVDTWKDGEIMGEDNVKIEDWP
eukprot:15940777-Heterocapsa_arctica.AAC.1